MDKSLFASFSSEKEDSSFPPSRAQRPFPVQADTPLNDPGAATLPALEARLARELAVLNQPAANWITPRHHPEFGDVLDVAIIGAGMAGMTVAFALIRDGVRNIRLFDESPAGFEGPWASFARMETLRSPKHLTGPALGLPSLAFRSWYEAQFGAAAWERLWRIPRLQWMDYLRWYRRVLALPVENDARMTDLAPHGDLLVVTLANASRIAAPRLTARRIAARRVILANGRDGMGGPIMPGIFAALPRTHCAHSSADIDFAALRGRRVAVVGAGASAFDNAGAALEAGAREVVMLMRRSDVPRINKGLGVSSAGMNAGFYDLPPDRRLAMTMYLAQTGSTPPRLSVMRCTRHDNFRWAPDAPVQATRMLDDQAVLTTPRGEQAFDFVIAATGFATDPSRRPEIARLAAGITSWADAYPAVAAAGADYAAQPFLGRYLDFQPSSPDHDWVRRVYCLNFAGTLSHYKLTGDIPAISAGALRLADGIIRSFFTEDYQQHFQRLEDFATPELQGDEWRPENLMTDAEWQAPFGSPVTPRTAPPPAIPRTPQTHR
jgi:cation diffusion facilitator CzcD-associated flavoprotein CzcO